MREAWFSHNGTMPLFLLFIVGIFLFRQFIILLEQICHAFALRHLYGEGIGLHHGSSVLAMRLKEFLRHERRPRDGKFLSYATNGLRNVGK